MHIFIIVNNFISTKKDPALTAGLKTEQKEKLVLHIESIPFRKKYTVKYDL
jgi:hypothetical protein